MIHNCYRSPEQEEPSEERDKRTVMCMQLGARVGKHELEEFFGSMGKKVSCYHYMILLHYEISTG